MTYFESAADGSSWDELGWENAPLSVLAQAPKGFTRVLRLAGVYVRILRTSSLLKGVQPPGRREPAVCYAPPWAVMLCEACKRYKSISSDRLRLALVSAQDDMEQRNAFEAAFHAGELPAVAEMIESSGSRVSRLAAESRARKLTVARKRVKEWTRKFKLAETKLSYWERRVRSIEKSIARNEA